MEMTMKTRTVRDIMTTKVHTLPAGARVADAAQKLTEWRVGGVPVLEGDRIVGVISKSDLVDPKSGLSSGGTRPISEVMTHMILTVRPSEPAMLAVRLMLDASIHRVVVVDEGGKLAGILSPTDVLRALERGEPITAGDAAMAPDPAQPAPKASVLDLRSFEVRI
jgi:CBS domain-containing protein